MTKWWQPVLFVSFVLACVVTAYLTAPRDAGVRVEHADADVLEAMRLDIDQLNEKLELLDGRAEIFSESWTKMIKFDSDLVKTNGKQWDAIKELRWEMDDIRRLEPYDGMPNEAIVSKDYPVDRIPPGVATEDKRPPEMRGSIWYMSVPWEDGKEKRIYPSVVDYKNPLPEPESNEEVTPKSHEDHRGESGEGR
jgi:hypothetical protein